MKSLGQETIAYHAARLLILLRYCGKPQGRDDIAPGIASRTLLAKLDFFLRYPSYLKRARAILRKVELKDAGLLAPPESNSIESRMIRYLYGPWDHVYYPTIAYLTGKRLIQIDGKRQLEVFRLTPRGLEVANQISEDPAYMDLAARAHIVHSLFHGYTGNGLKSFIYEQFPEVVGRKIGEMI
jgi:hypothetical protein